MISHGSEAECSHTEALLRRAATLITAAWAGTTVSVNGIDWIDLAERWVSDYERRDERIPSSGRKNSDG